MGKLTAISWTDHSFNPWWGCQRVSLGCQNCYAETFAKRTGHDIWGPPKTTTRRFFGDKHWAEPVKWNKEAEEQGNRHRVFTASMADVFEDHPEVTPHRARLFALIEATPWLDWQVLTKRPENIMAMIPESWRTSPPPNWWMGTSTEDQKTADERIPHLLRTPASVRFLSCEPLLGPIDLSRWIEPTLICKSCDAAYGIDEAVPDLEGDPPHAHGADKCSECGSEGSMISVWGEQGLREEQTGSYLDNPDQRDYGYRLNWVIAGGESGAKARPMHPDWARSLRDQCKAACVAFFFKQHGEYAEIGSNSLALKGFTVPVGERFVGTVKAYAFPDGPIVQRVGNHAAGDLLDGVAHHAFPVALAVPS